MTNYYDILEIDSNASFEEIKKAFRILAIKYHPDKNLGDNYFADKFIEVKQAYDAWCSLKCSHFLFVALQCQALRVLFLAS